MTFLDKLKAHVGGLIRIKTQLYWIGLAGPDNIYERVCLLADAKVFVDINHIDHVKYVAFTFTDDMSPNLTDYDLAAIVLLIIDGTPTWVRICHNSVELLK